MPSKVESVGQRKTLALAALLVLAAVVLAYANHFENGFHFDDFHTVNNNPYIRSLHNAKLFFTDPSTFSILPANRTYRPLVTLSLAFDYWLGGGLKPIYFHLDMFLWFLAQLALMFFLFRQILRGVGFGKHEDSRLRPVDRPEAYRTDIAALFAVALYGLHPAMAETVNYIIQRGDLYSTMLVVASLTFYVLQPKLRRFGIYLLPLALALITKQPAAIFPAILFAYTLLFEKPGRPRESLAACLPSLAVVAAMLWLQTRMMPASFTPGIISAHDYIVTQPWVALHYFLMFFAPVALTADTDQTAFTTIFSPEGIAGLLFLTGLAWAIWRTSRRLEWRPISFGLAWFLLALVPTSVYRLSELENDHRMFFPFVGLALAAGGAGLLLLRNRARVPAALAAAALLILAACAWGTHERNRVWRDEESLWRDVASKSPRNGRGLMNYGLTLMAKAQNAEALSYFQRALQFTPNYFILEINLAIVYGELRQDAEAERHFRRAMQLAPNDEQPAFYYGRWLMKRGRLAEAIPQFQASIVHNRDYLDPRYALMQAYYDAGLQPLAKSLAADTLQISPGDALAMRYYRGEASAEALPDPLSAAEAAVKQSPTAENYLNLSLAYHQAKRFRDCIRTAEEAIKLRPDFAEAYNNIAAAHEDLGEWDAAIAAAREAVRLKPDFQLAKNNLAYSEQQKVAQASRPAH
jgi:Flp pilus assembly protein TadD